MAFAVLSPFELPGALGALAERGAMARARRAVGEPWGGGAGVRSQPAIVKVISTLKSRRAAVAVARYIARLDRDMRDPWRPEERIGDAAPPVWRGGWELQPRAQVLAWIKAWSFLEDEENYRPAARKIAEAGGDPRRLAESDRLYHVQAWHFMLSVPTASSAARAVLEIAVRSVVAEIFEVMGYRSLTAMHVEHGGHAHAHVLVEAVNHRGERLRLAKDGLVLDGMRELLADRVRELTRMAEPPLEPESAIEGSRRSDRPELHEAVRRGRVPVSPAELAEAIGASAGKPAPSVVNPPRADRRVAPPARSREDYYAGRRRGLALSPRARERTARGLDRVSVLAPAWFGREGAGAADRLEERRRAWLRRRLGFDPDDPADVLQAPPDVAIAPRRGLLDRIARRVLGRREPVAPGVEDPAQRRSRLDGLQGSADPLDRLRGLLGRRQIFIDDAETTEAVGRWRAMREEHAPLADWYLARQPLLFGRTASSASPRRTGRAAAGDQELQDVLRAVPGGRRGPALRRPAEPPRPAPRPAAGAAGGGNGGRGGLPADAGRVGELVRRHGARRRLVRHLVELAGALDSTGEPERLRLAIKLRDRAERLGEAEPLPRSEWGRALGAAERAALAERVKEALLGRPDLEAHVRALRKQRDRDRDSSR